MAINWNYFSKREKGNAINIFRSQFNYTVQQKLIETCEMGLYWDGFQSKSMFFNEKFFDFDKFLLHCGLFLKPISFDSLLSLFSSLNLWMFLIFIVSFESVDWIRGQTVTNSDWLFVSRYSRYKQNYHLVLKR